MLEFIVFIVIVGIGISDIIQIKNDKSMNKFIPSIILILLSSFIMFQAKIFVNNTIITNILVYMAYSIYIIATIITLIFIIIVLVKRNNKEEGYTTKFFNNKNNMVITTMILIIITSLVIPVLNVSNKYYFNRSDFKSLSKDIFYLYDKQLLNKNQSLVLNGELIKNDDIFDELNKKKIESIIENLYNSVGINEIKLIDESSIMFKCKKNMRSIEGIVITRGKDNDNIYDYYGFSKIKKYEELEEFVYYFNANI